MSDIKGVFYREMRLYLKQPFSAFIAFVTPLLYFIFFGLGMAKSGLTERDYLAFFLPGYATISIFSVVNSIMQGIFNERLGGMLTELLSCPVRVGAYVVAKLLFAASVATIQTLILIFGVLTLVSGGMRSVSPLHLFILVPVIFFSGVLVSSVVASIVAGVTNIRSFMVVMNIVNPILIFASSIFYPIGSLPLILRLLGHINPLTWSVELIRGTLAGNIGLSSVGLVIGGALTLGPLATALNRWRILQS